MKKLLPLVLLFVSPLAFAAVNLSLTGLVELVLYLLIAGAILWLLLWIISYAGVPEPFSKIAKIIVMIVGCLILINLLLGMLGSPVFTFR